MVKIKIPKAKTKRGKKRVSSSLDVKLKTNTPKNVIVIVRNKSQYLIKDAPPYKQEKIKPYPKKKKMSTSESKTKNELDFMLSIVLKKSTNNKPRKTNFLVNKTNSST